MRIRRLDLLAYGHFTNVGFDLPAGQPDIHFVYGLNEAGKSTALSAIEDLLFGIPHNSSQNFLHDYASMRVGAAVEGNFGTLEFRRRKGTKDTLLDGGGLPLPAGESALTPYLNGAERAFYERMFCLDHVRLEQGGRGILEAQDDVGQILFSAGAGIAGLREQLRNFRTEADALWGSRHSSRRKYSQAEDRLKQAETTLREHTVTASQWHQLRTALDKTNEACAALDAQIEAKAIEARKLGRIRRVCRNVAKHAELTEKIAGLGKVIALPKDAASELDKHLNDDARAQTRLETLNEQIATLRNERAELNYDGTLLARGADIGQLHESRIGVRNGKSDLPKRRAELAVAEAELKKLATELDWQQDNIEEIIARLPVRSKVANARALSKQHGELVTAEESARLACAEADEGVAFLISEIADEGVAADISALAAAISAVRGTGDIYSRLSVTEKNITTADDAIVKLVKSLRPPVREEAGIASLPVPQKNAVEHHRDRSRQLAQRLEACRDQIRNAELALKRHRKEYERLARAEHAVPAETLQQLRGHRDSAWSIIRRKYVEGVSVSDAEINAFASGHSVPVAYQAAVLRADEAADQRFESAQATARLAEVARQIAEQEEQLEELRGQEKGYLDDENAIATKWQALWKPAGIDPLSPDEMLGWMEVRAQILAALDHKTAAEQELALLRDAEVRTKEMLTKELDALDFDTAALTGRPLRMVLELAVDTQRQNESKAASLQKLEDNLTKAKAEVQRKRKALQEAEKKLAAWKVQWSEAIALTGLNPDASIEMLDAQIEVMDEMREVAGQISSLRRERIEKIERDIVSFEKEVVELVASVAPHLVDREAEEAVLELESLLQVAARARDLAGAADTKIADEQKKIEECERSRRDATDAIARLQTMASVPSVDKLREAIRRSDELRSLESNLQTVVNALSQDGDGMTVAYLAGECEGADPDQIAAHEQTVNQELEELRVRQMEVGEARSAARREFEAIGGDDCAAKAAADRQAALSEMKDVAEEYVRLRSAELLLQWAVDRYRREKQGPLLKRAGELFNTLTGGSFRDLQVDYDDQDRPELAGIRLNGWKVKVSGMSTGSADQLYLALRVAAVEDFLSHSAPLPFIADDLFINFDDERAAAGFKVLAQLAQHTQVLFFTHHKHLLDLASAAIGGEPSTISLSPRAMPAR